MSLKSIRRNIRAKRRAARQIYKRRLSEIRCSERVYLEEYYLTTGKPIPKNPPKRAILEEVGNSVTHGVGALLAIAATVLMLVGADINYTNLKSYMTLEPERKHRRS